jgi:UMF1 family MFS transporter
MNKSVISWILYDVANTVFNLGVLGLFLPLWINHRQGTTDADLGFPVAIAMVVVLILSPFLGALTDQSRGRIRAFTVLNILAASATYIFGFINSVPVNLVIFCVAFVCVYLAELLYNAMLSEASTPANRGKVGGLGIGLGNLGSLALIVFALQYEDANSDYALAFRFIAVIFLLAALPITFFFVQKPETIHQQGGMLAVSTWNQLKKTRLYFKQHPNVPRFFVARYFYMIAVTTASTFAVLYGINTVGFTERQMELVILLGILVAMPSAVLWGYLVDNVGPGHALKWNLVGWVLVLAGSVIIPLAHLNNQLWWPLSVVTGFCFGGLWVADRPLLIQLSPINLGHMFGIYGMVSRLAFLTGALIWPLISVTMKLGQPAAVLFLLCCCLVGLTFLVKGQDFQR